MTDTQRLDWLLQLLELHGSDGAYDYIYALYKEYSRSAIDEAMIEWVESHKE